MIVTVSTLIRKADRGSFLRASAAVMQQSKATFLPIPSMAWQPGGLTSMCIRRAFWMSNPQTWEVSSWVRGKYRFVQKCCTPKSTTNPLLKKLNGGPVLLFSHAHTHVQDLPPRILMVEFQGVCQDSWHLWGQDDVRPVLDQADRLDQSFASWAKMWPVDTCGIRHYGYYGRVDPPHFELDHSDGIESWLMKHTLPEWHSLLEWQCHSPFLGIIHDFPVKRVLFFLAFARFGYREHETLVMLGLLMLATRLSMQKSAFLQGTTTHFQGEASSFLMLDTPNWIHLSWPWAALSSVRFKRRLRKDRAREVLKSNVLQRCEKWWSVHVNLTNHVRECHDY